MTTTYPTSLDSFTNPSASDQVGVEVGGRTHSEFHADINDAVEALQAKVGADSSAVTTSHDYKLSGVTSSAKAVSNNSNETITGVKTFATSAGIVATRPKIITSIDDANGNEVIKTPATASAVNEVTVTNAATGNNPSIDASGDDTNIGIDVNTKGTGTVNIKGNSTQAGEVRIYEDTDNGSNYTAIKAGSQSANISYTLPTTIGAANTFLTDAAGNGTLSWAVAGGGLTTTTVSLSSADILALHTTPKELVPTPGAGKIVIVESAVYSLDVGVQYTGGASVEINYAGDTNPLLGNFDDMQAVADSVWYSTTSDANEVITPGINQAVQLNAVGAAFVDGTGTLKVFITHRTVTL